ncbi:MAG: hypothetical protein BZ151_07235 [Desulfobacca sp. 4484_104]|nr:MAG: hypothetical protein BZ151_07235 [Desulfobacca sp. 4484_104]
MKRQRRIHKPATPQSESIPDLLVLPIEDCLDLHTFRPAEIGELIPEYLELCQQHGLLEVKIIHGKGTGALKAGVRAILKRHPLVADFIDAEQRSGGWGATLVYLSSESKT